jgi:hypothetical protein
MFNFLEFYSKNMINLLLFVFIGFLIAVIDISFRKIIKRVYLNVRRNIMIRHGIGKEGLDMASIDKLEDKTKEEPVDKVKKGGSKGKGKGKGKGKDSGGGGDGGDGEEGGDDEEGEGECPKDCEAVTKLQERLTKLIADATKLKEDVKNNNIIIEKQQKIVVELQANVKDLIDSSNK